MSSFIRPKDYKSPEMLRVLYSKETLHARLAELAKDVRATCGTEFLLIGLLKGSFVFAADLVRALHYEGCTPQIDFMTLSSYGQEKQSSGKVTMTSTFADDIVGKKIILVDDILESGNTLHFAKQLMLERGAESVHICVLLDKESKRQHPMTADFTGFVIEDVFVVGYGLDYAGFYRELPFIGALD
jgi:hypoxanthine phosphoribosyltransferase